MFAFDMPLEQLQACKFPQVREPDFDAFWKRMIDSCKRQPLDPMAEPVTYTVTDVHVEKVSYEAHDNGRIVGWCITPAKRKPRPTLIFFHGYGGDRGPIANYLMWALQGFTCLTFDVRGQLGESSDFADYPGGHTSGWMTLGILDPEQYYFTRCYLDTLRAIDFAHTCMEVDTSRIGITGCSQGGGLALAAACLDKRVRLCMAEVPGFCHFRRTFEITKASRWEHITGYFQRHPQHIDHVMRTLSYVELNNLTDRIICPTLVSVGLQDDICVPSGIYSAYNHIPANVTKLIEPFPYNGHEGGLNTETMIRWARTHLMDQKIA